jgi:hypothetical protein
MKKQKPQVHGGRFRFEERVYNIHATIRIGPGEWENKVFVATGCGSMHQAEKEFKKWMWQQGTPGRITAIEWILPGHAAHDEPRTGA